MNPTKKTMQVRGRETRPTLKLVKNFSHLVYFSTFAKHFQWRHKNWIRGFNAWRLMCYFWVIRSSFISPQIRSPIYDIILSQRSLLQNVSYIHFFATYRFLFVSLYPFRFWYIYLHDLKPKKSHARRSRTIIVHSFAFPFPASVSLASFFVHTHISSRLDVQFAYIRRVYAYVYVYVYLYYIYIYYINRRCEKRWQRSRR